MAGLVGLILEDQAVGQSLQSNTGRQSISDASQSKLTYSAPSERAYFMIAAKSDGTRSSGSSLA